MTTIICFSEDGKTCLTKDNFKVQNTNDPFLGYGLGTYHALEFTLENKPYKINIYKDALSEDDILESIKKVIDSKK